MKNLNNFLNVICLTEAWRKPVIQQHLIRRNRIRPNCQCLDGPGRRLPATLESVSLFFTSAAAAAPFLRRPHQRNRHLRASPLPMAVKIKPLPPSLAVLFSHFSSDSLVDIVTTLQFFQPLSLLG